MQIPYSVNRPEVLAFLGRNAKVVSEYDNEPIHIIMERVTSKTLDCYVEFVSFNEAVAAVNRFETNRTGGRSGRLGQRHVEVELSSQEHLMKDLFPKAKNVKWVGSKPTIVSTNGNDVFNSGFQGFVSREELVMLVKHVESPQRVSITAGISVLFCMCPHFNARSLHFQRTARSVRSSVLLALFSRYVCLLLWLFEVSLDNNK